MCGVSLDLFCRWEGIKGCSQDQEEAAVCKWCYIIMLCPPGQWLVLGSPQEVAKHVKISRAQRGKKKMVTIVVGLKTFGMLCIVRCMEKLDD